MLVSGGNITVLSKNKFYPKGGPYTPIGAPWLNL
jgi:hypothetical protein